MKKNNLCIIPARGGSKRIPLKNIKSFCGKPIISYAIELAISCNLFDEVMVSTDNSEIAKIAQHYGANIPFIRSDEASNDFATTKKVLDEVLKQYSEIGKVFDSLLCLYPTSVLGNKNNIIEGFKILKKFNSVLAVTKFSYPPQRGFKIKNENEIEYLFSDFINTRSQDIIPWYHDAGQWCWYNLENGQIRSNISKIGFIELNNLQVQDIDNIDDWRIAEIKYKIQNSNDFN